MLYMRIQSPPNLPHIDCIHARGHAPTNTKGEPWKFVVGVAQGAFIFFSTLVSVLRNRLWRTILIQEAVYKYLYTPWLIMKEFIQNQSANGSFIIAKSTQLLQILVENILANIFYIFILIQLFIIIYIKCFVVVNQVHYVM